MCLIAKACVKEGVTGRLEFWVDDCGDSEINVVASSGAENDSFSTRPPTDDINSFFA